MVGCKAQAHQRWGCKWKSWKREVKRCVNLHQPGVGWRTEEEYVTQYVQPRFEQWLAERHLDKHLTVDVKFSELPLPCRTHNGTKFIKYKYMPTKDIPQSPTGKIVYHGTYTQ